MTDDLDALLAHDQHLCRECGAWREPHETPCPNCGSRTAPVRWKGGGD